jgi:ferredoxin
MLNPASAAVWRPRVWRLFSIVFFSRLLLGLILDSRFLMTGKLHLPVPALILAAPVHRLRLEFMPILFLTTVLLVGPAWCRHLCDVGAWDDLAARARRRPGRLNPFRIRIGPACTDCLVCGRSCRFDALTAADIALRRPGATCTLCGDCLGSCPSGLFSYRLFGFGSETAREIFVVLTVSLHTVFLGLARIWGRGLQVRGEIPIIL